MPQRQLAGNRIRERRIMAAMRQADLASRAGISASYLNLIEHNRRRIGGKLLIRIAEELGVEPSVLSEGAEAALLSALREARAAAPNAGAETDTTEEFASRFPGWAALLADRQKRVSDLERTVEALTDRLTHDPHLAAALHEMLSTVTAIRSTASILADTREIEKEWRQRFHRNINEDAARLAASSQALVSYLDGASETEVSATSPQEELEAFLAAHSYYFPTIEEGSGRISDLVNTTQSLQSASARGLARMWLERYRSDAETLPLDAFRRAINTQDADPARIARRFNASLAAVMRRMASLPVDAGAAGVGMVSCDASGTITFRRPLDGFALPRFAAACPLWPLFQALSRPMVPLRQHVVQPGHGEGFLTYAISLPSSAVSFDEEPLFEAHMLILPADRIAADGAREIGVSCRICPRESCAGRREPSILADGF